MLHRVDGTGIRLHPGWSNNKVNAYDVEGHAQEVVPPLAGLGGSDGRGTYRWYKEVGKSNQLRFDGAKRPNPRLAIRP